MTFRLINSKRKTVALELTPMGELIVRAPYGYSKSDAQEFINKNDAWIKKHLPSIEKKAEQVKKLSPQDIKTAKEVTRKIVHHFIDKYASLMGVNVNKVKITSAQKRFGSCSVKNSICFSYMLVLYPINAVEYVVVHELSHIIHHNHSKSFYECVNRYLPNAKEYEKLLHPDNAKYENFVLNLEYEKKQCR